ncbi:protein kinase [Catenulispora yoronensis]
MVAADPDAELPWLASEYVPGPSVTEALMGFGPLSAVGLRTLALGLALALAEVHAAGVVHRDVKPSNVLLARDGPRLIDFGVARAIDDVQLTRVGAVIGSPGFLSPEQATGKPASFGSDVFSMASVVAYAACGVGPFGAGAGPALLYRVVHEAPKLVNVAPELGEVLAACLVKDPGDRPSAAEIAQRVAGLRGSEGVGGAGTVYGAETGHWLSEQVLADISRREAELAAWIEVAGGPGPLWERAVSAGIDFEVAADSALELANAGIEFEIAADSALELANAGFEFELAAGSAIELANAGGGAVGVGPGPGRSAKQDSDADWDARSNHDGDPRSNQGSDQGRDLRSNQGSNQRSDQGWNQGRDQGRAQDPDQEPGPKRRSAPNPGPRTSKRTSHRRSGRRLRFPVYAALGALLGAAAATTVLLLHHRGADGTQPPQSPTATASTGPGAPGTPSTPPTPPSAAGTQKTAPAGPSGRRSGASERTGTPGRSPGAPTTSASGSPR